MRAVAKSELIASWARYLYWAELMRRRVDMLSERREENPDIDRSIPEWLGGIGYWGASLYVAIEGWEAAGFTDPLIDALWGVSNYKDNLRRLRNGVFHYQPELVSAKFVVFFETHEMVLWIHTLHEELCRWLRDWIERTAHAAQMSPEENKEWNDTVSNLVGWFPFGPAEEALEEIRKQVTEIGADLDASGSDSETARGLRASLGGYGDVVKETALRVREYRRSNLAEFGLDPDDFIP